MTYARSVSLATLVAAGFLFCAAARAEDEPTFGVPKSEGKMLAKATVETDRLMFKPGKGLSITSSDGRFAMQIQLRGQLLYTFEREPGDAGEADTLSHKMELRRFRLSFSGHLFGEHNAYKIELALAPKDLGLTEDGGISKAVVLDYYLNFTHLRDFSVMVGQFKVPFSRERTISSSTLQMVDRSAVNNEFNIDRDMGISFYSNDVAGVGYLRWFAGVYLGENFNSFRSSDFGMLYTGRVELYPMGIYQDASYMSDLKRLKKARLALGGGYAYLDEAKGSRGNLGSAPADGGTTDTHHATADLQFKVAGFSVESAFHWRSGRRNPGPTLDADGNPLLNDDGEAITVEDPRNGVGWYAQAGFLIPKAPVEIEARFGEIMPLGPASSLKASDEIAAGLTWYIAHHAYKVQTDYVHTWAPADGISHGSDEVRLSLQASL